MMGPKTITLVVIFCNLVYIQCFPNHLLSHNDARAEDHFSDLQQVGDNFVVEDAVDDNVVGLNDPVALRASGVGGLIVGLGQMANGIVHVLGKGAEFLIGDGDDPPTIIVHQLPPPPIVVPPYLPEQVPAEVINNE
ncbi:uncharacterized protein LOC126892933 [Diabrotica virgifera virgifera]|uniref:Elastin-like n=1 Tax=Diabrotica virgifera virgifera TaxID=50390 RepID=A0ABM5L8R3_DIAVI|nr:uncharacterized protein LOC126892933 [Diabrotica virgifera virgifera]